MSDSLGTLYGHVKLGGDGESMGELLATSDGRIGFAVDGGHVSALVIELIGLDFGEAALVLGTRNPQVALRCAAASLKVEDGVAEPETFIVDTTDTLVRVDGKVNLGTEKLQLVTRPAAEGSEPLLAALAHRDRRLHQEADDHAARRPDPGARGRCRRAGRHRPAARRARFRGDRSREGQRLCQGAGRSEVFRSREEALVGFTV